MQRSNSTASSTVSLVPRHSDAGILKAKDYSAAFATLQESYGIGFCGSPFNRNASSEGSRSQPSSARPRKFNFFSRLRFTSPSADSDASASEHTVTDTTSRAAAKSHEAALPNLSSSYGIPSALATHKLAPKCATSQSITASHSHPAAQLQVSYGLPSMTSFPRL
ncbi:uncharacterized protein EI90DRAFT_632153 [Cantharellus anzutake]|uniref:uncharacterized protein n=1 Tax=Cantharellus anzutake TaxID=1750568 RepID=UPI001907A104|nr:uncharacterized protein EI90DRAFT_632153 [Cantharellus anzutake]KAF8333128.1 hypothetical protein EI90DRAFT_632153 [Cantharellus anzutake]